MERIRINKSLIPYTFDIQLGNKLYTFRVDYNGKGDMFTVALYDGETCICAGEPLIYGVPLWTDVYVSGVYPISDIVPTDINGDATAVTYDNLDTTVFLYIDDGELTANE